MKVDFDNTKIAFERLSSSELIKAYGMFSVMKYEWLVNTGNTVLQQMSKLKLNPLVGLIAKPTIYDLFVGGKSLETASPLMESQFDFNVGTVLDFGAEAKNELTDFKSIQKEILRSIEFAANRPYVRFVVTKLSGLTNEKVLHKRASGQTLNSKEDALWNKSLQLIEEIGAKASALNVSLFIDAEESWLQYPMDEIALNLMRKYNQSQAIIWNTLQMYRRDRLDYLSSMLEVAREEGFIYGIKLVRGAYMEKERKRARAKKYADPIQPTRAKTDSAFNMAIENILNNLQRLSVCIATHNVESCQFAMQLMNDLDIKPSDERVCFSQLYGMGDYITYNMAKHNYNVSKYMPYGKVTDVIPYLMRRAEENTSVAGQVGRELNLLKKEMKRRNLSLFS